MDRKFVIAFVAFIAFVTFMGAGFAQQQEQLTLTTYYPAPYGAYTRLRIMGDNDPATPDLEIGATGGNQTLALNGLPFVGYSNVRRIITPGSFTMTAGASLAQLPGFSFTETGRAILFISCTFLYQPPTAFHSTYFQFKLDTQFLSATGAADWRPAAPAQPFTFYQTISFSDIIEIGEGNHTISLYGSCNGTNVTINKGSMNVLVFRDPRSHPDIKQY